MTIESINSLLEKRESFFQNQIGSEWMSTSEAAQFLRITPNALRILACRGKIKFFKIGRHLRFNLKDLNALLLKGA